MSKSVINEIKQGITIRMKFEQLENEILMLKSNICDLKCIIKDLLDEYEFKEKDKNKNE